MTPSDAPSDPGVETCVAETVNEECARVRCRLPRGHRGLHDDRNGCTWAS